MTLPVWIILAGVILVSIAAPAVMVHIARRAGERRMSEYKDQD